MALLNIPTHCPFCGKETTAPAKAISQQRPDGESINPANVRECLTGLPNEGCGSFVEWLEAWPSGNGFDFIQLEATL